MAGSACSQLALTAHGKFFTSRYLKRASQQSLLVVPWYLSYPPFFTYQWEHSKPKSIKTSYTSQPLQRDVPKPLKSSQWCARVGNNCSFGKQSWMRSAPLFLSLLGMFCFKIAHLLLQAPFTGWKAFFCIPLCTFWILKCEWIAYAKQLKINTKQNGR